VAPRPSSGVRGQVAYTTFFYVFPDGRFVSRWARWLVLVWAVLSVPDVFFPRSPLNLLDGPLFFGLTGGAVLAQVYRYVRMSIPVHGEADQGGGLRDCGGGHRCRRDERWSALFRPSSNPGRWGR
jgi:hypothetical protein